MRHYNRRTCSPRTVASLPPSLARSPTPRPQPYAAAPLLRPLRPPRLHVVRRCGLALPRRRRPDPRRTPPPPQHVRPLPPFPHPPSFSSSSSHHPCLLLLERSRRRPRTPTTSRAPSSGSPPAASSTPASTGAPRPRLRPRLCSAAVYDLVCDRAHQGEFFHGSLPGRRCHPANQECYSI